MIGIPTKEVAVVGPPEPAPSVSAPPLQPLARDGGREQPEEHPQRGRIIREVAIRRGHLKHQRDRLFVFGDNMTGKGLGGQAREMRGEPNAVGIPTKWRPEMSEGSFFSDADWDDLNVRHAIVEAFDRLERHLAAGGDVVIPALGVGTGLAELSRRSPQIFAEIERRFNALEEAEPQPGGGAKGGPSTDKAGEEWRCECGMVFDVYATFSRHRTRTGHKATPERDPADAKSVAELAKRVIENAKARQGPAPPVPQKDHPNRQRALDAWTRISKALKEAPTVPLIGEILKINEADMELIREVHPPTYDTLMNIAEDRRNAILDLVGAA